MHVAIVILGGLLLLAVFLLFSWLWREAGLTLSRGALAFLPVWAAIALVNLWVGVTKAGYTVREELPILALVVAVPALTAGAVLWRLTR